MTMQRPSRFATPGWLAAAGLSVAAHAGVFALLPDAGSVAQLVRAEVPAPMQVRLLPEDPPVSHDEVVTAASPAPQPDVKAAAIDRAPTRHRTVPAVSDPWGSFLPSRTLDVSPLPRSSPDLGVLTGVPSSGLPLRLRLFVDERGRVVEVRAMQVQVGDEEVVDRLRHMFLETLFLPGKLRGSDVASYMDLELAITDAK